MIVSDDGTEPSSKTILRELELTRVPAVRFLLSLRVPSYDRDVRSRHISIEEDFSMNAKLSEGMEVIGADGVHVGTVDRVEGARIKLKKSDSYGRHEGHHHYIELGFIAGIEGDKVRLSANSDIAVTLEEEPSGKPVDL